MFPKEPRLAAKITIKYSKTQTVCLTRFASPKLYTHNNNNSKIK